MSTSPRDIKRRLRSVTNTRKITKAMELVSSVKMRKAVLTVTAARPYAEHAWEMLLTVAQTSHAEQHPLLRSETLPKKIAVLTIASNRGLVGGFNANLTSAVSKYVKNLEAETGATIETIIMGAKGRSLSHQYHLNITAEFPKEDLLLSSLEIRPMAKMLIDGFTNGDYDRVIVAYMDYISSLVQKPVIRQILPLSAESFTAGVAGIVDASERTHIVEEEAEDVAQHEYLFEPNADQLLESLLPRLVEMQIYRAVLETNAAEHAARMVSMKNASDSAGDLITDLTLSYNQARQAAITQDLSEISAGRAALEG